MPKARSVAVEEAAAFATAQERAKRASGCALCGRDADGRTVCPTCDPARPGFRRTGA